MRLENHGFPRAWVTYILCLIAALLVSADLAGLPPNGLLAFIGVPIALIIILISILIHLVRLPKLIRAYRWKGILPILLCTITLPLGVQASQWLLDLRFLMAHDKYETVAEKIRSGTYHPPLKPEDSTLGLYVNKIEENNVVVAVAFMVVSHGFAGGHAEYLRVYDDKFERSFKKGGELPDSWGSSSSLGKGWYLVQE